MQAKADKMQTRENNSQVFYEGHAVMWQGANRISANSIEINRDEQTLHAVGDVISTLVDNKSSTTGDKAPATVPTFTIVRAPELRYRDDTRVADYTGGVKLVRGNTTVDAKELRAFLSPKTNDSSDNSSLDHAFADGHVKVVQVMADQRTRTGTSEHCEYYPKDSKVVLNGGNPQVVDSYKGVIKARQLTYFADADRVIAEGQKKELAFTQMKKK
jgi:lipopolysaccharide export system protein LptA